MEDIQLIKLLAQELDTTHKQLISKSQKQQNVHNRAICYFIFRSKGYQVIRIGKLFNRDHTTVVHGLEILKYDMSKNIDLKKRVYKLQSKYVLGMDLCEYNDKSNEEIIQEVLRVQRINFTELLRLNKGKVINESLIERLKINEL